ncbi:hypothetical protein PINS_up010682 [Pythium insidiosum]|nr:hypothetical protein PINS_up010682 [Pythium insidiosum]
MGDTSTGGCTFPVRIFGGHFLVLEALETICDGGPRREEEEKKEQALASNRVLQSVSATPLGRSVLEAAWVWVGGEERTLVVNQPKRESVKMRSGSKRSTGALVAVAVVVAVLLHVFRRRFR